ncbi:L-rhamnose-binding lectin SML-like [Echeneis naucrates]|uniref:L-rhamnose-binding lectin SML-like n=1 Tax=Echeneis naucrates TaxID=173247 RepID=A0A665T2T7_ECHNA|nr:L-rhamnose-binding lectin SML-like [Echeneis naucrates]
MLHFSPGTALLLATTCLLATEVSTERVVTCDDRGNVQLLRCDIGVVRVQSALYGRTDGETCREGRPRKQLRNTECSQNNTVDIIKRRCDGKKMCEINTDVVRISDPCVGTYKYLETYYTCFPAIRVIACENSVADLFCAEGQVIYVYGAEYGRRDQTTCIYQQPSRQIEDVECLNPTDKVAESCNGKNRCTISARNSVFGDPCVGTYKYLDISYVCEYPVV